MNDEQLQREIEQALAVEPSLQFVARVRQHLVQETTRRTRRLQWKVVVPGCVAAAAAAIMAAILLYEPSQPRQVSPAVPVASVEKAPQGIPVAETPSTNAPRRKTTISKTSREPEVLIDPREAAAFRSFVNDVQQQRIDPVRLHALFDTAERSRAADEIQSAPIAGLEPIVIPPLIPVAPEKEGGSL
jgi:hypothetical protein